MAISAVSISNVALSQLGANYINSFSEGSTEANLCNVFWDQARVTLLTMHPWNFAIERVEIAQDVGVPVYDYQHQYTIPSNCLRVLQVFKNDDYRIEGRKILTNRPTCFLKYVKDITDTSTWSRGFVHAMTAFMRQQLSYPITKNPSEVVSSSELFSVALTQAKAIDASQDIEDPFVTDSAFINVRF